MKKLMRLSLALTFIFVFANYSFSQSLKEKIEKAGTIYVAPLRYHNYFAVQLAHGSTLDYSISGDYSVGDNVGDGLSTTSFEITAVVPQEKMDEINAKFLARLQEEFGDKVKPWPEGMTNKLTGMWDQKNIDSDLYIILQRAAIQSPVTLNIVNSTNPAMASRVSTGSDVITLTIFEKEKAGKKGKKVVKVMKNSCSGLEPNFVEFEGDGYSEAGIELSNKAIENLPKVIDALVDDFIAEINSAS